MKIIILFFSVLVSPAFAVNAVYLAAAAAGGNTGADCADAKAYTYFNTAGNWSATPTGIQIGPGTTVHVCGTITGSAGANIFTFQGSGSSGSPVTLLFESGAIVQAPYMSTTTGGIVATNQSWIVIDGGTNGIIQDTLNGTSGAACPGGSCTNQQNDILINLTNCTNTTVQNLQIGPDYYRVATDSQNGGGTGININNQSASGATNITINNDKIHDASSGIFWFYGSSESGFLLENSELYRNNWGLGAGAASNNLSIAGIQIRNNKFHDFANWDDYPTPYNNHHDATTIFGGQTNNSVAGCYVWNNEYYGDFGSGTSPGLYIDNVSTARFTCTAFNNLFHLNSSGPGGTGAFDAQNESGSGPVTFNAYNNTIYVTLANNQGLSGMWIEGTSVTTDFRNNIVVAWVYDLVTNNSGTLPTTSNFNDFYTSGTSLFNNNGATYNTVSAWNTATSLDANSIGTNPNLNTSIWYPNSGSPVIGLGTNLTSLCTGVLTALCSDKNGTARPSSGAWDAGAYQAATITLGAPRISNDRDSAPTNYNANPFYNLPTATYPQTFNFILVPPPGATACYTLNGSTPTAGTPGTCDPGSSTYTVGSPVTLSGTVAINAISTEVGFINSAVASVTATIQPFWPLAGSYVGSVSPTLTSAQGTGTLVYTTDGSTPAANSACVATNGTALTNNTSINISNTTTVKFIPCTGGTSGSVQTAVYTINSAPTTWYVRSDGGVRFSATGGGYTPFGGCNGTSNAPYPGTTNIIWNSNTVFAANTTILDNTGHYEHTTAGGTSGSGGAPTWGGTVTDGTITWVQGALYPTNQPCAFNDWRYLYDDTSYNANLAAWVIAGGDIVYVRNCLQPGGIAGGCRVGENFGVDAEFCVGQATNTCTNGPIPQGNSTYHTKILGFCVLNNNCTGTTNDIYTGTLTNHSNLNEIFGGSGVGNALTLSSTNYVDVQGLNIDMHSPCIFGGSPAYPHDCSSADDYDSNGLGTDPYVTNVTLTDIWDHGHPGDCVKGGVGAGITLSRFSANFCKEAAWNFDDGADTPDGPSASINANYVYMTGNGCKEQYPIVNNWPANACYDLNSAGFGDSWSGQDSLMSSFTCNHCQMIYNTKDGFIGPHTFVNNLTITNSASYGNMGQQWKWGSVTANFNNNYTEGGCNDMTIQIPGAAQNFNLSSGLNGSYLSLYCRASGDVFSFHSGPTGTTNFNFNTIIAYSATIFDLGSCNATSTCGGATMNWKNNLILGYTISPNSAPAVYYDANTTPYVRNASYADEFGVRNQDTCGGTILCVDPLLNGEPAQGALPPYSLLFGFTFHPISTSPLLGAGQTISGITTDYYGITRPNPPAIGAAELAGTVAGASIYSQGHIVWKGNIILK